MAGLLGLLTGGWNFITGLSPKQIMYGIAALFIAFMLWKGYQFVDTALDNAALVAEQAITIQLQEDEIAVQIELAEQRERAAAISEAARLEAERRESELRQITDAAIRAKDEDNGAIAPVLGDTLRALRERN